MVKKGLFLICLVGIAFSLFIAGCAQGETGDSEAELEKVTVVLDWTPNINHTGLYVAAANGYFEEEGLDVEIIQPGDNLAPQLVASGQADFGVSYQEEVTFARVSDIPVVSLAAVIQNNTSCFAAPVANEIDEITDFAGKTYGGWGGEVEEALINYLVEDAGMKEPVEILNIGSSDFFAATDSGTVDFSWIFYGVTGIEAELRDVELDCIYLRDIDETFNYYTPVLISSESYIEENPEICKKFLSAVSRGYEFADANPEDAADILLAAAPELDAELVTAGQKWMAGQYQGDAAQWGYQDINIWTDFGNWMQDRGLLTGEFVAEDAFTNEFLPEKK